MMCGGVRAIMGPLVAQRVFAGGDTTLLIGAGCGLIVGVVFGRLFGKPDSTPSPRKPVDVAPRDCFS